LTEVSGLALSTAHPGTFWVHNDSGDSARLFALGATGAVQSEITVLGAQTIDWEDLALAPDAQGRQTLYIADIGDNNQVRGSVALYAVPEPDPGLGPKQDAQASKITLRYPEAKAHNAEAIFVDPATGELFLITKDLGGYSKLFVAQSRGPAEQEFALVRSFEFGRGALVPGTLVTGAAMSADGSSILVRTYFSAFLWRRAPGQSVAQALEAAPCPVPLAKETQGETIAFGPSGYFTLSEGKGAQLFSYARLP
jgi:hypothetical protein